jgi:murein DD-endopeptidase MepM/ murein hydrolase activator NlpD
MEEDIMNRLTFLLRSTTLSAALLTLVFLLPNTVHSQADGPYYFISDDVDGADQFFSEGIESYGGIPLTKSINLLATVLGDNPSSLLRSDQTLVPKRFFDTTTGPVKIQPFVSRTNGDARMINLPIGANLRAFLDDPLGGADFDLSLPFVDPNIALSDHSGALRASGPGSLFHFAIDFDSSLGTTQGFDIVAPADGVIEGNDVSSGGGSLTIRHAASNGRHFLTYYQHLVPNSNDFTVGTRITRGQKLGKVESRDEGGNRAYTHLHFGIAVRGPARGIGGINIPEMWYELDPLGVYDYRRNRDSVTAYNYLPNNTLSKPVHGQVHAFAFRTSIPIGSLLFPEDCISFNAATVTIRKSANVWQVIGGVSALFSAPRESEARRIVSTLQHYGANRVCYVGRPQPSFEYLLTADGSPVGTFSREDCLSFNSSDIELIKLDDGTYQLVEGSHQMFQFPDLLEAANAYSRIMKYRFRQTCFVGRPGPSLRYQRR